VKVGDLVRSADAGDDDIGIVVSVTLASVSDRIDVWWGTRPGFGRQFEWDWEFNLEIVEKTPQ
jgi:hypothetical protein